METEDRKKLKAIEKFALICKEAQPVFGRDPRGGGFSFVGRPLVIRQALVDTPEMFRRLHKNVVVGTKDADVVFYWEGVPFRVRHNVKTDDLWVMRDDMIIESKLENRAYASQLRMESHAAASAGKIVMAGGN